MLQFCLGVFNFYHFMYMSVSSARVCIIFVASMWRLEEDIRSAGSRIT